MKIIDSFRGQYRFLSNFYDWGWDYTVEHLYQAGKATTPEDADWVSGSSTAAQAKKRGREIAVRPDWEQVKYKVMEDSVRLKFQDKILAGQLLETGDAILIEGNYWHDNYWGTCFCSKCPGVGQNLLGRLLMRIREELKNERTQDSFGNPKGS